MTHPAPHPGTETSAAQITTLLHRAAIAPLDHTGWLRITGSDRVRWLNGMATNSIQDLKPGEGNYNFFLNAQGRIQGDATIFAQQEALLLETAASQIETLAPLLDRFIIMDDVELAEITGSRTGLAVIGPEAPSHLEKLGLSAAQLKAPAMLSDLWNAADVTLIHAHSPLVPRFELWSNAETITALTQALTSAGTAYCDAQNLEWLRILEGTPRYGTDIRDRDLPQETGQARALHFNKGCYLGQEIVERIRSRGSVHRVFTGFVLTGEPASAGTELATESAPRPVGELTSVATIPRAAFDPAALPDAPPLQVALGYIRRETLDRNLPLAYPGGTAQTAALPFALPGVS